MQALLPGSLNSAHGVSALDALSSFAQHADTYRWIKPNFVPVTSVEIKGCPTPVVEETIENYVPNDCDLDAQHRLHIITGPNRVVNQRTCVPSR